MLQPEVEQARHRLVELRGHIVADRGAASAAGGSREAVRPRSQQPSGSSVKVVAFRPVLAGVGLERVERLAAQVHDAVLHLERAAHQQQG